MFGLGVHVGSLATIIVDVGSLAPILLQCFADRPILPFTYIVVQYLKVLNHLISNELLKKIAIIYFEWFLVYCGIIHAGIFYLFQQCSNLTH